MDKSILMQKQVKDNTEDLQKEFLDLSKWAEQMKRKDEELRKEASGQTSLPPIRSKVKTKSKKAAVKKNSNNIGTKRIKSCDYSTWDKFDVDKACQEVDKDEQSNDAGDEIMFKEELEKAHKVADKHKSKGNVCVQQQKWVQAIKWYNKAIEAFPYDAVFYANRALCQLKLDNLHSAESDCTAAIQLDQTYVKAYYRRATARMNLKQCKEAKEDLERILKLEPSNVEAKSLLSEIENKSKASKSAPVKEDTEKLSQNLTVEKKIGKEMCSIAASNVQTSDNKDIGVIKHTKNVEEDIKDITIKKKELDPRIPDWLPEKHDVCVIEPIEKPPHLRSKKSLTRIPVEETDFTSTQEKSIVDKDNKLCDKSEPVQLKEIDKVDSSKKSTEVTVSESSKNVNNIPPVPKTAVQFIMNWKTNKSSEFRYKYLKQLPENSLPKIFQDSMESDIFSQILEVLRMEFLKRKILIFCYLKDLSQVKRFRALIMFMSNNDKESLRVLFEHCKTIENVAQEELTVLKEKYEI